MNKKVMISVCWLLVLVMLCARGKNQEETTPSGGKVPAHNQPAQTSPSNESIVGLDDLIGTMPVETEPAQTTVPPETEEPDRDGETAADPVVEPDQTEHDQTEPDQTEPDQTEPDQTEPDQTEPVPEQTAPVETTAPTLKDPAELSYEEYLAMTPAEQQAHYERFASLEAYIAWHNAALAEYEENQTSVEVTGPIDIGDFITP